MAKEAKDSKRVAPRKRKRRIEAALSSDDGSDNVQEKKTRELKDVASSARLEQTQGKTLASTPLEVKKPKKKPNPKKETPVPTDVDVVEELAENEPQPDANRDFAAFYLRKVTMELEEDLDKVRSAGDFQDSSLPILVTALKQGESIFSAEEKARVLAM